MYLDEFYKRFTFDESPAQKAGHNPYYLKIGSGLEDKILVNGSEMINLASNNYLGLAADARVKQAAQQAIEKYGASLCGTPIATGYIDLYKKLEEKLSGFLALEETIILPSCYQANNGLFSSIAGPEDLIIVDRYAHSSLILGIKSVGCKIRPFLHNNMDHLEGILKRSSGYRQIFVVTESVFSTEGSVAPFNEIIKLCEKYHALPVVDDSHGIGVLGKSGRGILEEKGIEEYQGVYTASLGKAIAGSGGIISGKSRLIKHLKYYCPHLVYSTALTPPALAGIEAVLEIIEGEFSVLKNRLSSYQKMIYQSLLQGGFPAVQSETPINSVVSGSIENTFAIAKKFYGNGILSTPFVEPSVPRGDGRVRLIAGANLLPDTVQKAAAIISGMCCR